MSDSLFDQAEAQVEFGKSWKFREEGMPNPLTIQITGWSLDVAMPNGDLVDFVRGTDRDGEAWSILVGGAVLKQHLVEGRVEAWNDEKQAFELVETKGRVQPGEVVSLKYDGDKRSKAGYDYPTFRFSRVGEPLATFDGGAEASPAAPAAEAAQAATAEPEASTATDDIPF